MKRLMLAMVALVAAALLPSAAAASSRQAPLHPPLALDAPAPATTFVPLVATLSGTGTLSGTLLDFNGAPVSEAGLNWTVTGDTGTASGAGVTAAAGTFTIPQGAEDPGSAYVPAATGNGIVIVTSAAYPHYLYQFRGLSWPAAGRTFALRPGRVALSITPDTSNAWFAGTWKTAEVELTTTDADGSYDAYTVIPASSASPTAATITLGSAGLTSGTLHFWNDQGVELAVDEMTAGPGVEAAGKLVISQKDAQGISVGGWASGRPGSSVWLLFQHFPAGWVSRITGAPAWPFFTAEKSLGTKTCANDYPAVPEAKRLTIPSSATPGYRYYLTAEHRDVARPTASLLSLTTPFQTCTLNGSRTTIRRGGAVRLSGVVPVWGHSGTTPAGAGTKVTLYRRSTSAGQPVKAGGFRSWNGWTRVATYSSDGLGKYRSGRLHPKRTTWYVAWYRGTGSYWPAYTSVRKVTVR